MGRSVSNNTMNVSMHESNNPHYNHHHLTVTNNNHITVTINPQHSHQHNQNIPNIGFLLKRHKKFTL